MVDPAGKWFGERYHKGARIAIIRPHFEKTPRFEGFSD
jgi:hypothetical protein